MDQRWSRVEELFAAASNLAPADRASYLANACADDPGLREEVAALLDADDGAHRALTDAVGRAAAELLDPVSALSPGTRIGAWRVTRELARGGMGAVYLAERADGQYDAQAAIKLVHAGPSQASLVRRFRVERQILASLHHPNIARLLDGGAAEDGTPYVVMEYVAGEPITTWCDRKQLPVRDRLRLFVTVCRAVEHAHRNLVVHRDLKPSNIFVAEDGSPKLLDFGIAKLLAEEPGEHGDETTATLRLMTPAYASPEQARGGRITTATDVYSLGVVLFELLTGNRPYRVDGLSATEAERVISTTEPTRPSVAVKSVAETVSRLRATSPDRLRRQLSGDLDTILMMALRKEPERRYQSVERLAEDIERHLEGLPVLARGDSFGYWSRKFVTRHSAGVVATMAILGLTTVYGIRLGRERDRARTEARNAEQVAAFLSGVFSAVDPAESRGTDVTARELLERSALRVDRELAGQPREQATLLEAVGGVYRGLGLYTEALPFLERALELRHGRARGDAVEVARAEFALAGLLVNAGILQRAESLHRSALRRRERALPADHPDRIRSLVELGDLRGKLGDETEAERLLQRAVDGARRARDEDWEVLAEALTALGSVSHLKGGYEASDRLHRESLELRVARAGADHPRTLRASAGRAQMVAEAGDVRGADSILRDVIGTARRVLGPEHPDVAGYLRQRSGLLMEQGQYRLADSLAQEVLALLRGRLGPSHPEVGDALFNLGWLRYDQAMLADAEARMREALAIHQARLPADHPSIRGDLNGIALILTDAGRSDSALRITRRLLASVRSLGAEHPDVLLHLANEGTMLRDLGRVSESDSVLREGLAMVTRNYGEAHIGRVLFTLNAAINSLLLGRYQEAAQMGQPVLETVRSVLGDDNRYVVYSRYVVGRAAMELGQVTEGEVHLREAVRILESFAPRHWGVGYGTAAVAAALAAQGRWQEADRELARAQALVRANRPPGTVYLDDARRMLERAYGKGGRTVPIALGAR